MREFINKNKVPIGGVLLVGAALWAYFTFFSGGSEELLSTTEATSPVSQELLVTLSNLRTIHLDESIFEDTVFVSLSDFGVTIPLQAIGRRNPFAPLESATQPTEDDIEAPPGVL